MRSTIHRVGLTIFTALTAAAGIASAQVFSSSNAITINDAQPADPYPSSLVVSDGPTSISRISVRLTGLSHTYPGDLDIMLVAPGGQSFILMSDAGSNVDLNSANLLFADGFPQLTNSPFTSGTYACTDLQPGDLFPAPAPSTAGAQTSFASLVGTDANGLWSLFIIDDFGVDSGSLQSWSLEFNNSAAVPPSPLDTAFTYQGRLDSNGAPVNGLIDVRYQFWSDPTSTSLGSTLSGPLTATGVQATNGLFSVEVPAVSNTSQANSLYLDIAVRVPSGSGDFVPLTPRQRVAPALQSSFALAASSLVAANGSPLNVVIANAEGRVGLGTTTPQSTMHIQSGNPVSFSLAPNGFLTLGRTTAANLVFDNDHILARNNGNPWPLFLNASGDAPVVVGTRSFLPGVSMHLANGLLVRSGPPESAVGIAFGAFSDQIGGSVESTDPVGIFRYNPAPDVSFLRFCAGDVPSAQDGFQFGIRDAAGNFTPQFVFLSNGTALKPGGGMWSVLSDPRAKHDIAPLTNTLDRLMSLRGYSYEYNADMVEQGVALPGRQIGLMADEVERIFPDWITRDDKGTRFVTERSTTALMVEALRDLRTEKDRELAAKQAEIENLKARLDRLEAALIAK